MRVCSVLREDAHLPLHVRSFQLRQDVLFEHAKLGVAGDRALKKEWTDNAFPPKSTPYDLW